MEKNGNKEGEEIPKKLIFRERIDKNNLAEAGKTEREGKKNENGSYMRKGKLRKT